MILQMTKRIAHKTHTIRPRTDMVRRWVETADERCPLACVWFALPTNADATLADQDDDPGSMRPTFSYFSLKAGCCSIFTIFRHPQ